MVAPRRLYLRIQWLALGFVSFLAVRDMGFENGAYTVRRGDLSPAFETLTASRTCDMTHR